MHLNNPEADMLHAPITWQSAHHRLYKFRSKLQMMRDFLLYLLSANHHLTVVHCNVEWNDQFQNERKRRRPTCGVDSEWMLQIKMEALQHGDHNPGGTINRDS